MRYVKSWWFSSTQLQSKKADASKPWPQEEPGVARVRRVKAALPRAMRDPSSSSPGEQRCQPGLEVICRVLLGSSASLSSGD